MNFTWNETKRQTNLKKHGFDFTDTDRVFTKDTFTRPDNRFDYGEQRFNTIGLLETTVVVISHTETEDTIHVISMRKGERYEREYYFSNTSLG